MLNLAWAAFLAEGDAEKGGAGNDQMFCRGMLQIQGVTFD